MKTPKSPLLDALVLKTEWHAELMSIANWWLTCAQDHERGGWFGQVDNNNIANPNAPKGSVLNSRILWSFASVYRYCGDTECRQAADDAFSFLTEKLLDKKFGGLYWTIDAHGHPLQTRKQVYATAFGIYALAAYHLATGHPVALQEAMKLFLLLEDKAYDKARGGYREAFDRQWQPIDDMRLSNKDVNAAKTMNTHLHVLEAYTWLYRCTQNVQLYDAIDKLLHNFFTHFIHPNTHHLQLFFDANWQLNSHAISYGHDIEAAWLLQEAAESIGHQSWMETTKGNAVNMARAAMKGVDADGGLWYEFDKQRNLLVKEKHWWPQAEAMVGFYNAFQCSGEELFALQALKSWQFIQQKLIAANGEWYWGISASGKPMAQQDKAGLWKCPYHNSRACIEMIKRATVTNPNTPQP